MHQVTGDNQNSAVGSRSSGLKQFFDAQVILEVALKIGCDDQAATIGKADDAIHA